MKRNPFSKQVQLPLIWGFVLLLAMSLACNLTALLPATPETGVSSEILTQAAATIEYALQLTASEAQPLIVTSTSTPTATSTSTLAAITASPTTTSSPTATMSLPTLTSTPTASSTPFPTLPFIISAESNIKIRNLNIYNCYGIPWGIFKITNLNSFALESSSIQFEDLDTGHLVSGPYQSNAPFMFSDRTCSTGIDRLLAGRTGYLGYSMGTSPIREHLIRTTIVLCSKENLSGTCQSLIIDFTMP